MLGVAARKHKGRGVPHAAVQTGVARLPLALAEQGVLVQLNIDLVCNVKLFPQRFLFLGGGTVSGASARATAQGGVLTYRHNPHALVLVGRQSRVFADVRLEALLRKETVALVAQLRNVNLLQAEKGTAGRRAMSDAGDASAAGRGRGQEERPARSGHTASVPSL